LPKNPKPGWRERSAKTHGLFKVTGFFLDRGKIDILSSGYLEDRKERRPVLP